MLRFSTLIHQFLAGQMPAVNFWSGQIPRGQIPGVNFGPDKCLELIFGRTNAWSQLWSGQMPGGQMPAVNFWSDKCLESIFGRTNAWRKNVSTDKCQYRHLSYEAFVLRGTCLLTRPDGISFLNQAKRQKHKQ